MLELGTNFHDLLELHHWLEEVHTDSLEKYLIKHLEGNSLVLVHRQGCRNLVG